MSMKPEEELHFLSGSQAHPGHFLDRILKQGYIKNAGNVYTITDGGVAVLRRMGYVSSVPQIGGGNGGRNPYGKPLASIRLSELKDGPRNLKLFEHDCYIEHDRRRDRIDIGSLEE